MILSTVDIPGQHTLDIRDRFQAFIFTNLVYHHFIPQTPARDRFVESNQWYSGHSFKYNSGLQDYKQ